MDKELLKLIYKYLSDVTTQTQVKEELDRYTTNILNDIYIVSQIIR